MLIRGKISNIEKYILDGVGIIGMSKVGLAWIKSGKESAIISVNREAVDSIKACFALQPEELSVERISGTIRSLRVR